MTAIEDILALGSDPRTPGSQAALDAAHIKHLRSQVDDLSHQKHIWTYGFAHLMILQNGLLTTANGAVRLCEALLEQLPVWAPVETDGGYQAEQAAEIVRKELAKIKGALTRAIRMTFTDEGDPEPEPSPPHGHA